MTADKHNLRPSLPALGQLWPEVEHHGVWRTEASPSHAPDASMGPDVLGGEGPPHQPGVVASISGIGETSCDLSYQTRALPLFAASTGIHHSRHAISGH